MLWALQPELSIDTGLIRVVKVFLKYKTVVEFAVSEREKNHYRRHRSGLPAASLLHCTVCGTALSKRRCRRGAGGGLFSIVLICPDVMKFEWCALYGSGFFPARRSSNRVPPTLNASQLMDIYLKSIPGLPAF